MKSNNIVGKRSRGETKPRILILFYSLYGHVYELAKAAEKGIKDQGGEPVLATVSELIPKKNWSVAIKKNKEDMSKIKEADPIESLKDIDGILVGSSSRFGIMSAQMKGFWDQTSEALNKKLLEGKPAAVFGASAAQHAGNEISLFSMIVPLIHHGCLIVGLPLSNRELFSIDEMSGGTPYGATTVTGELGEKLPSEKELHLASVLGARVTSIAAKLK